MHNGALYNDDDALYWEEIEAAAEQGFDEDEHGNLVPAKVPVSPRRPSSSAAVVPEPEVQIEEESELILERVV